jgi:hypothetical protein
MENPAMAGPSPAIALTNYPQFAGVVGTAKLSGCESGKISSQRGHFSAASPRGEYPVTILDNCPQRF